MSDKCYKCFRSLKACCCKDIKTIDTGIKFVFLMHPKEAFKQKTGTGRLAALSLKDSEIIIGIDFTKNERLNELISAQNNQPGYGDGRGYMPVVLYPAQDAYFTDSPNFRTTLGTRKLLVIVVDATWFFAHKMILLSKNLHALPKLSFRNAYRSQFRIKRQPQPACLSTIESAYYLLEELKTASIAKHSADTTGLMDVFRKMVDYQLECQQERQEGEAAELYPVLFLEQ